MVIIIFLIWIVHYKYKIILFFFLGVTRLKHNLIYTFIFYVSTYLGRAVLKYKSLDSLNKYCQSILGFYINLTLIIFLLRTQINLLQIVSLLNNEEHFQKMYLLLK